MDERSLKALEFDKIRESVAAYAFSSLGAERSRAMVPAAAGAAAALAEVAEMTAYAHAAPDLPLAGISDIGPLIKRLALDGVLVGAELIQVRDCLLAAGRAHKAFGDVDKHPYLSGYAGALAPLRELTDLITSQIDDDGIVRDDATPKLANLRRQIGVQRQEITAALERILNSATVKRALRDPIITQRGGRYVLPVRTDAMGSVRGIVHGHSSSGVTAFVEPMALVELNNKLEGLLAEEEAEVERILRTLSHRCAAEADTLAADLELLRELDFIAARTGFGLALRARTPALAEDAVLVFKRARHPLLLATRDAAAVVPIDLELGREAVGLIISGPNNGGKTVALKTAGLLTAMALAGVPIPVAEGSEVGLFDRIYADVGDESSIEGNLSTFTAHMANVGRYLGEAGGRTLVLLDELGVGTSPKYGVAIATAVLKHLRDAGARIVCTTHYDELKTFAFEEEGFLNAAVDIDPATLEPTYDLKLGRPGTSEAFAILGRLRFPQAVMDEAAVVLGAEEASLAALLTRLTEREAAAERAAEEAARLQALWEGRRGQLDAEYREYEANAARLRQEAYDEAAAVLRGARRQAATILRELKDQKELAQAENLRRELLEAEKEATAERDRLAAANAPPSAAGPIAVGGWATVRGTKTRGEVLEVDTREQRARVRFGAVEVWVDLGDLAPAAPPDKRAGIRTPAAADISPSLNLIGARVEDALLDLARYLDQAALAHLPSVEVIHGHGTGRLRDGVRRFLRTHPHVASFGPGPGGNEGCTIVQIKG